MSDRTHIYMNLCDDPSNSSREVGRFSIRKIAHPLMPQPSSNTRTFLFTNLFYPVNINRPSVCFAEARDGPKTRDVVVKVASPDNLHVLNNEGHALWRLQSTGLVPRIIQPPCVSPTDLHVYILLEKLGDEWRSLYELADESVRWDLAQRYKVAGLLLDAIQIMHGRGVTHGDLTPKHFLISRDLRSVRLIDFGMAFSPNSETPYIGGTPGYAYPAVDNQVARIRRDIYGLCASLYYLFAGETYPLSTRIWNVAVSASNQTILGDYERSVIDYARELIQQKAGDYDLGEMILSGLWMGRARSVIGNEPADDNEVVSKVQDLMLGDRRAMLALGSGRFKIAPHLRAILTTTLIGVSMMHPLVSIDNVISAIVVAASLAAVCIIPFEKIFASNNWTTKLVLSLKFLCVGAISLLFANNAGALSVEIVPIAFGWHVAAAAFMFSLGRGSWNVFLCFVLGSLAGFAFGWQIGLACFVIQCTCLLFTPCLLKDSSNNLENLRKWILLVISFSLLVSSFVASDVGRIITKIDPPNVMLSIILAIVAGWLAWATREPEIAL